MPPLNPESKLELCSLFLSLPECIVALIWLSIYIRRVLLDGGIEGNSPLLPVFEIEGPAKGQTLITAGCRLTLPESGIVLPEDPGKKLLGCGSDYDGYECYSEQGSGYAY